MYLMFLLRIVVPHTSGRVYPVLLRLTAVTCHSIAWRAKRRLSFETPRIDAHRGECTLG